MKSVAKTPAQRSRAARSEKRAGWDRLAFWRRGNRRKTRKMPARGPRTKKQIAFTVFKWGAIGGLVLGALAAVTVAVVFWRYGQDPNLPTINSLGDYHPKQVSRIAAADGTVVGELFTERRTFVPIERIPDHVVKAFVAAEDASFFEHSGIDYIGIVRAAFVNVRSGEKKQGASTITQQVVKTFLLSPERTFKRKIQEIILARRLEDKLSKEEILTLYLNQIYFGHGRYGVQEAARFYFGKNIADVNVGEAALIAGLPQAPEHISPIKKKNRERAKVRQKYVLEQMAHHGYITEVVAKEWIDRPIEIVSNPFPDMGAAPEWVDLARRELARRFGDDQLDGLGARVTTTLDRDVQQVASEGLRMALRELDERHKYGRAVRSLKKNKPDLIDLEVAKLARKLPKGGPVRGEVYEAVVREIHDDDREMVVDLGDWKASVLLYGDADERYNPKGLEASGRFTVGDVVRVQMPRSDIAGGLDDRADPKHASTVVDLEPGPEGAIVVMDPNTREVLAVVGGYSTRIADFNRATMAKRQPGSAFKPFVYAAALDTGDFTSATIVNDAPEVYNLWKPENYKKGEFEGPVRLRHALAKSINTVAIRVLSDIGPERAAELARRAGISAELPSTLSLALGSGEVTPLELTNAYATFAAGGVYAPPRFVRSIDGEDLVPAEGEQVIRPEVAYVITDMMRSVVTEGTAGKAARLRMPVAGKTGTSNDARDAWFVGMTPELVVGVWVGFDDNRPLGRGEGGSRSALPAYVEVMDGLSKRVRSRSFPRPQGVVEARIDKATGLLAPADASAESAYTEVFIEGTEPIEVAPAPGEDTAASFVLDQYDEIYDRAYEEVEGKDEEPLPMPRETSPGAP